LATWEDVRRIAMELPGTTEHPAPDVSHWKVKDKLFVWERPLRRADRQALGDDSPKGPILAARVPDLGAKEALLTDDPNVYFTTPHFDGYPSILIRLEEISVEELEEIMIEAWLDRAPKRMVKEYLEKSG